MRTIKTSQGNSCLCNNKIADDQIEWDDQHSPVEKDLLSNKSCGQSSKDGTKWREIKQHDEIVDIGIVLKHQIWAKTEEKEDGNEHILL